MLDQRSSATDPLVQDALDDEIFRTNREYNLKHHVPELAANMKESKELHDLSKN